MQIRKGIAIAGLATSLGFGLMMGLSSHSTPAHASGTTIEKITETKTMLNSNCYETVEVRTTYYTHSVKLGWVAEPSPKVQTTRSETCDK